MTPLVLVPGMMCDARLFAPQIAAFSAGRTISIADASGSDNIAALAAQLLDEAPPRFALCGLSMGGIIAMEVLRRAPERVERIALLDTNPLAETDTVRAGREPQIERANDGHLAEIMRDEMKPNYLADGPRKQEILDLCMDMALALGPEVFVRQSRALQTRRDQTDTLSAARLPALVLMGADDQLCPLHRHTLMHELLGGSILEVIEGAGHLPTLEQPEHTNAALKRWLET
ncbi:hydrolase [Devosia pacifica]|uniref:Hydrolase n=1 Tax=Devosia pacifica TaxID=1335967 RepID=A0A918VXW1_9HYPH|nr:alpha/beta fold hydrolase [Devosia pacifica]GHA32819.1 hydrolase [Devosia pacifica]